MRFIKSLFLVAVLAAVVVPNAMAFRFTDAARNTPTGVTGSAYSHALSFAGGCNQVTVFIGPGSLPPGLRVVGEPRDDSQDGWRIEGTPTQAGNFTFWINAKSGVPECQSAADTTEEEWTMRIAPGLAIEGPGLPIGTQNVAYPNQQLTASGGGSQSWSIASGALPNGMSLSSSGLISGVPDEVVQGKPVGIRVSDTSGRSTVRPYEVSIRAKVGIAPVTAPAVTQVNAPMTDIVLRASGGSGDYTWTLEGQVPPGVTITKSPTDKSAATLGGTPTAAGLFNLIIKATDVENSAMEGRWFTLPVRLQVASPVSIVSRRFAALRVGRFYTLQVKTSGGVPILRAGQPTMRWRVASGKLPFSIRLNTQNGKLIGTARRAGTYRFTLEVTDRFRSIDTQSFVVIVR